MPDGMTAFLGVERSLLGGVGGSARPTIAPAWRWRSSSGCRRSSAGCWPRAASRPETAATLPRARPCAISCPTPRCSRTWTRRSRGWSRAIAGGELDRGVRRLRRRRRHLGGAAAALLRRHRRRARLYMPDRQREGYGPTRRRCCGSGPRARASSITVDCGTAAHAPLAAAAEAGLDVIVVDHHVAEPALPPALAVINPNRLDESGAHGHAGRGRRRLPAAGRRQPRRCARPAGMPGGRRARSACSGSTWWRSARSATWCR